MAFGRTPSIEEFLTLCGTKYPATQPLPECRLCVAELQGEKNSWLSARPNTPQQNLYLSVGGVWQNSEYSMSRWPVAELRGEKNSWLFAGPNTPQQNLYLSVGGVWQNSEERRILDSLRDQIPRTLSLKRLTKLKKQYTVLIFKGLLSGCHSFCLFSYFTTYIHSFNHNKFIRRHSLKPLSISSSLCKLIGENLPVVSSRESNSGLPYSKPARCQRSHAAP